MCVLYSFVDLALYLSPLYHDQPSPDIGSFSRPVHCLTESRQRSYSNDRSRDGTQGQACSHSTEAKPLDIKTDIQFSGSGYDRGEEADFSLLHSFACTTSCLAHSEKTDFIWAGKHGSIGVALQPNGHSEWTRLSYTDDLGPILIPIIMQSRLPVECRA
jgi:hypothetical protein